LDYAGTKAQGTSGVMRGLDPRIHRSEKAVYARGMDCRVKPGNDENVISGPPSMRIGVSSGATTKECGPGQTRRLTGTAGGRVIVDRGLDQTHTKPSRAL
jgi:hypothetical protein